MWNLSASLMDAKTKRRQLGAGCWVTALRGQESRPSLSCSLLPVYFRARPVCSHRYLPLYQQPQRPLHLGYVTETMRLGCLPNACCCLTSPPTSDFLILSSVQSFSRVRLLATPWTAAHQASLSITNSQSLLKLMSIELVMPTNNLILCCPILLLLSVFPNIRVFSNESAHHIRWPSLEFQLQHQSFQ